jgi:phage protein D
MSAQPIFVGQNFFAPTFEIHLKGQSLGREVIRDVLEVSYKDDMESLDSFEFTLNDWDPVRRVPKYSSPFDENGQPLTRDGDFAVPSFEPGAKVELHMGYQGAGKTLMMVGQIVSLSPSFPASGNPTLRVRALNLLYTLQQSQETIPYEDQTDSQIAEDVARRLGVDPDIPGGPDEEPHEYVLINNDYPILFLLRRARRLGYDVFVKLDEGGDTPRLFFGPRPTAGTVYELEWGKSLISFTPTLKTKGQVAKVTVRGWDPTKTGEDRSVVGEATWQDLDAELPDPALLSQIDAALAQSHEEVVDEVVGSEEAARERALGILRNIARGLITGRGSTVGFPELRAGRRIHLKGLGTRFSGNYLIKETTHAIGASGYTTQFTAEMEILRG